ncbi:MAG: nitric oxide reductase large subunit [Halieaceae bacterium]
MLPYIVEDTGEGQQESLYAFSQSVTISDENMHALNAFIFWTSWHFVRSAEFIHSTFMEAMVWGRVPGDLLFALGAAALFWSMMGVYRNIKQAD